MCQLQHAFLPHCNGGWIPLKRVTRALCGACGGWRLLVRFNQLNSIPQNGDTEPMYSEAPDLGMANQLSADQHSTLINQSYGAVEPSSSRGATLNPTYAETPMPNQDAPAVTGLYDFVADGFGGEASSSYNEIQGFAPSESQTGTLQHATVTNLYDFEGDGVGGGAESSFNEVEGYMDLPAAQTGQQGDGYLQMDGGGTKLEDIGDGIDL